MNASIQANTLISLAMFSMAVALFCLSARIAWQAFIRSSSGGIREFFSGFVNKNPQRFWPSYKELSLQLRQAGYVGTRTHVVVLILALIAALVVGVTVSYLWNLAGNSTRQSLLIGGCAILLTIMLLRSVLKSRIKAREKRMESSIEILVQVTRMLWSTGMTLEMLMYNIAVHLDRVAPDIAAEVQVGLARIQSGQAREDVLQSLSKCQPYAGLAEYFRLMAQLSSTGGRAAGSLQVLGDLVRDIKRTHIQEQTTKMSAKMSLVMMVCFFPAMLIVMTGPALAGLSAMFNLLAQ